MNIDVAPDEVGHLFSIPSSWADMDAWHERVGELRRTTPVVAVDQRGYEPFWVLTRHADVFDFNQALMDFGALQCPARKPQCATCPLQRLCRYK